MAAISESEITCPKLKIAYDEAFRNAFSRSQGAPSGVTWDNNLEANHVTLSDMLIGNASCSLCHKSIAVVLHFQQISAVSSKTNRPVNLYSTLDPRIGIGVSGHKCKKDQSQK